MTETALKVYDDVELYANDNGSAGLVRYEAACRAVAAAKSVDEVKDWHNKSDAMRAYAKQAKNKQLETDAAEIRIRAERRLGELMAAQRDAYGTAQGRRSDLGQNPTQVDDAPITLSEVGMMRRERLASETTKQHAKPNP